MLVYTIYKFARLKNKGIYIIILNIIFNIYIYIYIKVW